MRKILLFLLSLAATPTLALTALEIMQKVDAVPSPEAMNSTMTMVLVDKNGKQRVRQLESQRADFGDVSKSLMFFIQPSDVRGTGFLMYDYEQASQDDDQWLFLPALQRAKRIASSDKSGSFMGSDFSYADMTQRNLEEWNYRIIKEDEVGGQAVWLIEATAANEGVIERTGYQKSVVYVRQDNYVVIRAINYLQKPGEVKLMNVSKLEQRQGYWITLEMQMLTQQSGQTTHRTLMKFDAIDINPEVDEQNYSLNRLEQGL